MKKGKAMGIDNIPTESLQALGDFGINGECELNRRIAVAKNNFSKMSRILTDHDMSLATKIRLRYAGMIINKGCQTAVKKTL